MPVRKLMDFLDKERVKYATINHAMAFTAQDVAASAHVPGREMAKTVIVKIDGKMAMIVLPADHKVDLGALRKAVGAQEVALATEDEFKWKFPESEIGAMPPFGNLYGIDTYVEDSLTKDDMIAFNAGSHTELIKIAYADYARLAHPKVVGFR